MDLSTTTKTGAPRKKQWASKVRTGCLTCRKRRVKCDEAKPNCNRCIAVNRECLGASYGVNHDPEGGEAAKKMISPRSPRLYQEPSSPVQFYSSQDMIELGRMIPELEKKLLVTSALDTPTEICLALSCSKMYHCLGMLPCRAGYEPSLDSAAKCVVMGLRERFIFGDSPEFNTTPVPVNSLGAYVDALKPLRQALCDPARSHRPEVLCAAQLLGIFESLIQNRPHLRFQHVFGAEQLIQYRGTHGFSTPFEQNLLLAQVPVIIGHSLPSYQKPFLADDEWMAVLESCAQAGNEFIGRKTIDMYQAHLMVCSIFPDVTAYIMNGEYDKVKHDFLLFRIQDVLDRLAAWRQIYEIRDLVSDTAPGIQYGSPTTSDASSESSLDIASETSFDTCSDSYSSTPYGDDETAACNTDTYTMMANRLYIAMGGKGSMQLEAQTQHIANRLLERHSIQSDTIESFTDGHILLSMGAARAMLATANDFAAFAAVGERAAACGRHAMIPSSFFEDLLNHYGFPPPPRAGNSNYSESTTY